MDPSCEAHFAQLAQDALAAHLHRNAVFLAERLHASSPTESHTHLLATAYLRSQQPQRAHAVLKGASPRRASRRLPHPRAQAPARCPAATSGRWPAWSWRCCRRRRRR